MRCYNLTTARQHLAQVSSLILDGQQLEQLPSEVWKMPLLETLDLRRNALKVLPETIGALKSLKYLFLGNNQLQELPQSMPNVVQIDLSGNRFSHFPTVLAQLEQLQTINLGSNQLRGFPNLSFPALKELHLSGNKIAACLLSAAFLPKLEKLHLSRNGLRKLEIQGAFSSLDTLDLAHNHLAALPDVWSDTPFLRHLNLSNNQLAQLPSTLSQCSWLKTLKLAKNKLSSTPNYFTALHRLEELDLSGNALPRFPALPTSLRTLDLANNQLTQIPAAFFQTTTLRYLNLSQNPLRHVKGLGQAIQLKQLMLKGLNAAELAFELLALPSSVAIKSSSKDPQWTRLLNFVHACQRKQLPAPTRSLLWNAQEGKTPLGSLPLPVVLQGMNLGIPTFQQQLRQHLLEERSQPIVPESGEGIRALAIIGRSSQTLQELKTRLEQRGITLLKPDQCSHWVLAKAPYPENSPNSQEIHWLDERKLEQLLSTDSLGLDADEQQNLLQLLLHKEPEYVQLALQLLTHQGVPHGILPYLYLVWRWTKVAKLRREMRALLERYWPSAQREVLRSREKVSRDISREALEQRVAELLETLRVGS
ncbi:leucine-rich repeat domain-containing protein [Haliscomenobacter sp.]|uniref:leucine-rich repeat domain-containing protein n=1 Tax=Haliscomenobacter sp. TaxID=2717303 RepID=UPI00359333B7